MSSDDYANHIIQKYRIATAIAVLRTKPENILIENHISILRDKIKMNIEEEEIMNNDLDVTSEDFDIDTDENTHEIDNFDDNVARHENITETGSVAGNDNNYKITDYSNNLFKPILSNNIENNNMKINVICTSDKTIDNLNNKSMIERNGAEALKKNNRYLNDLEYSSITIENAEMANKDIEEVRNSKANTYSSKTVAVDDELLINNVEIQETTSLNESVNILKNFDVNMAEDRHSLTEVLGVLRDISHNKVEKIQNNFVDLTKSQQDSDTNRSNTRIHSVDNNYCNIVQNDFIDLTHTHTETLQATPILNINNAKRQTDSNNIELNDNKSKDRIAQSLAKKIRKNLDRENINENNNQSFENIINRLDPHIENRRKTSKATKDSKEIDISKPSARNSNHMDITEFNDIYSLNAKKNEKRRENIQKDIASKVLQNINKAHNLNQPKLKTTQETTAEKISESIQNNSVYNQSHNSETHTTSDMDLDTNCSDLESNYHYRTLCEPAQTNKQTNIFIANKILNNINKNHQHKDKTIIVDNNIKDTQDTILYSLQGFTQNYTHVSQSQNENIEISDKFIYGTKKLDNEITTARSDTLLQIPLQDNQIVNVQTSNIEYIIDKDGKMFKILSADAKETFTSISTNNKTEFSNNNTNLKMNTTQISASNVDVSQENGDYLGDIFGIPSQNLKQNLKQFDQNDNIEPQNSELKSQDIDLNKNLTPNVGHKTQNPIVATQNLDVNDSFTKDTDSEEEIDFGQKEVIPFKVIEELNKVKVFLNRAERCFSADGYITDSGYRSSDSQSRSSYKSAHQLSGNWLNQSAHCIYTFIVQCPLVAATEDICHEISVVLGRLIDKLHEEERYPSFIEDILDTINAFLEDLHDGENNCENVLQKKDENIRRLLLLNQSQHLLRYTIEKITEILEKTHQNLTTEEIYELTRIDQIENVSYIFYLLEKLLNRYLKVKNEVNRSSQNSQSQTEEKILKKSSISEIWRKKWNPDGKGDQKLEVCVENNCLTKCGETLNKIIVDCMDGYSLVSFAALQCFNILQNL